MSTSSTPVAVAVPKPSDDDTDHPLVLSSSSSSSTTTAEPPTSSASTNDGKGSSTFAAVSRALAATLAFMFKRPIRLFRPVKISTWAGIQAIAEEQGRSVSPAFVRALVRKEGWKFIPRHVLPPMLVNTTIGLTLFWTYTTSERYFLPPDPAPVLEFLYVPFVSGSLAGAAQSLLSAPLDNARLLLLRRQRYLRMTNEADKSPRRNIGKHATVGRGRSRAARVAGGRGTGGLPFTNWISLLKFSLFQPHVSPAALAFESSNLPSSSFSNPNPASSTAGSSSTGKALSARARAQHRIEAARRWARKGWSLFGLTLVKDSIGFGVFFAVFELGREASRRVGLAIDGVPFDHSGSPSRSVSSLDDDGLDRAGERSRDSEGPASPKRRTATGLVVQSFGILVSGGLAGWIFSIVARPFERVRAAVWEGRARWAERDARLRIRDEREARRRVERESEREGPEREPVRGRGTGIGVKLVKRKSKGGRSERRAKKLLGDGRRKIGNVRIGQVRRGAKTLALLGRRKRRNRRRERHEGRRSPVEDDVTTASTQLVRGGARPTCQGHQTGAFESTPRQERTPLPSAPSLVRAAFARYGPTTYLFASRSVLQALDARLAAAPSPRSFGPLPASFSIATSPAATEERPLSSEPTLVPEPRGRARGQAASSTVGLYGTTKGDKKSTRREGMLGPTRTIARRRLLDELDKVKKGKTSTRGWTRFSRVFTFVPPYAIGFLVFALVQGDLKIEV
ncbi:hypothetical protein JCM10212_006055 [Sporobolomyces blumeae]